MPQIAIFESTFLKHGSFKCNLKQNVGQSKKIRVILLSLNLSLLKSLNIMRLRKTIITPWKLWTFLGSWDCICACTIVHTYMYSSVLNIKNMFYKVCVNEKENTKQYMYWRTRYSPYIIFLHCRISSGWGFSPSFSQILTCNSNYFWVQPNYSAKPANKGHFSQSQIQHWYLFCQKP